MSSLHEPDQAASPEQATPHLSSSSRRKLIKLGASAVPVALTLPNRSAMAAAGQCNTTSAWGSAILRNGVASARTRAGNAQVQSPVWGVGALVNNTATGGLGGGIQPWQYLFTQRYGASVTLPVGTTGSQYAQTNLKVRDLFPTRINGYTGSPLTVFAYLSANQSTSNFVTCMLVARINTLYGSSGVNQCLSNKNQDDILGQMAMGQYQPSNSTGAAWTKDNIVQYLTQNNIVVA